jgi:HEAT repeat protein
MFRSPFWIPPALACLLAAAALPAAPARSAPTTVRPEEDGPSRATVEAAVKALRAAFASRDPEVRIAALEEHRVPDREVVALLARGLRDDESRVRRAALEALRWTPHSDALRALHRVQKRDTELRSDEQLGPALYRAIGQHADPASIDLLEERIYSETNRAIVRARLWAIGNIRDREALESLIALLRAAKPETVKKYVRDLRVALIQLTGVDQGEVPARWLDWWSDHRRDFEMAEEPPLMPIDLQRRWDSFWGIRRVLPREERREDRGGEGDRDS